MRTIEAFLILANLLTFAAWTVSLRREVPMMRHSAPFAMLLAALQVLIEGTRWQMIPAYALTGLFFFVWLLRNTAPMDQFANKKQTHRVAFGAAAGMGVLGLAVSITLPVVLPVFRLPHPSGPHEIGTLTYHWVDANRREVFSDDLNARRELIAQIWYPARKSSSSPHARYIPDAGVVAAALARLLRLPEFTFGHLEYVISNATSSAPVSDDKPDYRVLIFMEGLTGFRQMNTFQVEELVSHGYVVAAIDQPYTAATVVFPDGRQIAGLPKNQIEALIEQSVKPVETAPKLNGRVLKDGIIPYLAQDAIFTLDQLATLNEADPNGILTGRLAVQRAGIFGISLGGIAVSEACRLEARFQACLVMDAPVPADVIHSGLQQPTMWITRDAETMRLERRRAGGWSEKDINDHQTTMRAAFESLRGDGYLVRVPGMFHSNFTDIFNWSPLFPWLGVTGPINGQRAHSIINAYSLAFFDQHLAGRSKALLDEPSIQYPEVLFDKRRPSPSK